MYTLHRQIKRSRSIVKHTLAKHHSPLLCQTLYCRLQPCYSQATTLVVAACLPLLRIKLHTDSYTKHTLLTHLMPSCSWRLSLNVQSTWVLVTAQAGGHGNTLGAHWPQLRYKLTSGISNRGSAPIASVIYNWADISHPYNFSVLYIIFSLAHTTLQKITSNEYHLFHTMWYKFMSTRLKVASMFDWPMVKTGDGAVDKSSVLALCTSIIVRASQPRSCTAGNTRGDVDDDDDGLSPAINNYHLLAPVLSTGLMVLRLAQWTCDSKIASSTPSYQHYASCLHTCLCHQAV